MLKKGIFGAWVLTAFFALAMTPGFAQEKVLINGFDADYPPFSFVDKDGKPAGFDMEALDWIAISKWDLKSNINRQTGPPSCPPCSPRKSTSSPPA